MDAPSIYRLGAVFHPSGNSLAIFGNVVTFTRIRAIETTAGSAGDLTFFAASAASNSFIGPMNFGAQIRVRPGCTWAGIAPNADGWPVIAGTGDVGSTPIYTEVLETRNWGADGPCTGLDDF
jgi:hypothetical protein